MLHYYYYYSFSWRRRTRGGAGEWGVITIAGDKSWTKFTNKKKTNEWMNMMDYKYHYLHHYEKVRCGYLDLCDVMMAWLLLLLLLPLNGWMDGWISKHGQAKNKEEAYEMIVEWHVVLPYSFSFVRHSFIVGLVLLNGDWLLIGWGFFSQKKLRNTKSVELNLDGYLFTLGGGKGGK